MLAGSVSTYGSKPFLRERTADGSWNSLSFDEFGRNVDSLARALLQHQEKPVVGIAGSNSAAWVTVMLATLRAGGISVPIDRELPVSEMHAILHYSGANMFFFDPAITSEVAAAMPERSEGLFTLRRSSETGLSSMEDLISSGAASSAALPSPAGGDDIAVISYTSGTMGAAKGVVLSHANILSDLRQMLQSVGLQHDEVFLSVLPLHHMYECVCGMLCPLCHGCTVYFCRGLRHVADDLASARATLILGVPLLWENMYRKINQGIASQKAGRLKFRVGLFAAAAADALGVHGARKRVFKPVHEKLGGRARFLVSGGAGIDPEVVRGFRRLGMEMLQGYGLTECSPIVAVNRDTANKSGSVGPPLPEVEVRIEDADETGIGEIVVRGPNIMLGYHEAPAQTAEVLSPQGWFRTGDYGFLDSEGYLFVTGRKKNVIVSKNGKNVYPEELESKLTRSGLIQECMVFGRKSDLKGEEIWAIVFPSTDKLIELAGQAGSPLEEQFAIAAVRREISGLNASQPLYKRISNFMLRESEFPKTTTKKIRRVDALREAGLSPAKSHGVIAARKQEGPVRLDID